MSPVARFLLYNLLPAMAAGIFAWALVHAGIQLLRIRHGKLRLCLYMAPLIKSTLVLTGMTLALRWPRGDMWCSVAAATRTCSRRSLGRDEIAAGPLFVVGELVADPVVVAV